MLRKWLIAAFALASALAGAQTTMPISQPHVNFVDAAGLPCTGCKLYSYIAGSTTPLATYTDASGGTPNTNPVVLDVAGGAQIWLGTTSYKFILKTALGSTIWTVDNVSGYLGFCSKTGCAMTGPLSGTSATFSGAISGGALTATSVNNVCAASSQVGATADVKIMACQSALPSAGGIIDASGLTGAQTLAALVINKHVKILLGPGVFTVSTTINATNLGFAGFSIIGTQSSGESIPPTAGTVLLGNTGAGTPVIDTMGSENVLLEHFTIQGGTSTVGVLEARTVANNFVQWHKWSDVHIVMPSTPSANGGNGTIGIYNYGAEIAEYSKVTVTADKPIVFTATNIYSIAAPNVAYYGGGATMSRVQVIDSDFYSTTAQAVTLSGAQDISIDAEMSGNNLTGVYAMWADQSVFNIRWKGLAENFDRLLRVGGRFMWSNVDVTCGGCGQIAGEPIIYLDTASGESAAGDISHTVFKPFYVAGLAHNFIQAANTSGASSVGWELHIPFRGSVSWAVAGGGWLDGKIYYDSSTNSDNTVSAGINAVVTDKNGTSILGSFSPVDVTALGSIGTIKNYGSAAGIPFGGSNAGFGWNASGSNGEVDIWANGAPNVTSYGASFYYYNGSAYTFLGGIKQGGVMNTTAGYQINGVAIVPSTTAGPHGTATHIQMSDNSGASGNCVKFDANGNMTDAGAPCGAGGGGSGTVTSVAMTVPSWLSVAGSPVTTIRHFGSHGSHGADISQGDRHMRLCYQLWVLLARRWRSSGDYRTRNDIPHQCRILERHMHDGQDD
jgi:hypothetical protein